MTPGDVETRRRRSRAFGELRERARARNLAKKCGVLADERDANVPERLTVEMTFDRVDSRDHVPMFRAGDISEWWLADADVPAYGRAIVDHLDVSKSDSDQSLTLVLTPIIPEFWESLRIGAGIELCRDRRTVGYATVVQVGRAGTLGLEVDDRSDLQIIEAEIALRLPNQSGPIAPLHSGDLTSWILPLDGRLNIAGAEVEIPNFPQIDPGDSGWVRIYPLAAYLWKDVDVGTSLALRDDLHGGDDRGAATVVRLNRAGAVATR